jgi:hypothetical protein
MQLILRLTLLAVTLEMRSNLNGLEFIEFYLHRCIFIYFIYFVHCLIIGFYIVLEVASTRSLVNIKISKVSNLILEEYRKLH